MAKADGKILFARDRARNEKYRRDEGRGRTGEREGVSWGGVTGEGEAGREDKRSVRSFSNTNGHSRYRLL